MTKVTLTASEMRRAGEEGALRLIRKLMTGATHRYHNSGDNWSMHINAVGAEIAVAKLFNVYVPLGDRPDSHDLVIWDEDVDVKHTNHPQGDLCLQRDSPDDMQYVLVRGQMPHYEVMGVIVGKEGKLPEYWNDRMPSPCFTVPADKLRPL